MSVSTKETPILFMNIPPTPTLLYIPVATALVQILSSWLDYFKSLLTYFCFPLFSPFKPVYKTLLDYFSVNTTVNVSLSCSEAQTASQSLEDKV